MNKHAPRGCCPATISPLDFFFPDHPSDLEMQQLAEVHMLLLHPSLVYSSSWGQPIPVGNSTSNRLEMAKHRFWYLLYAMVYSFLEKMGGRIDPDGSGSHVIPRHRPGQGETSTGDLTA
ncbi:hypothetical protein BHE74_00019230 [Ensete ventricosum]|nr:hypothetical protein BHE74_00019230 [Ensete ventricosum]